MEKEDRTASRERNLAELHKTRGFVITKSVQLEVLMDKILMLYYCRDSSRKKEFHDDILQRTPFNKKIELIDDISSRLQNPGRLKAKPLVRALKKINDTRNQMAHAQWASILEIDGETEISFRDKLLGEPIKFNGRVKTVFTNRCEKALLHLTILYYDHMEPDILD